MHNLNPLPESIYTVGGTVQAGSGFYIPREADERLLNLCRKKEYAYVLTTRQVGKSSLMIRTAEQLTDEGTRVAIVDLTALGVNVTADQWYQGFVKETAESLMLQMDAIEWWRQHEQFGNAQRLIRFFETVVLVEGPVVVFVDEIDTTRSMPFTDDFYAALRFMWNDRAQKQIFNDICFVLIGVATPHDLIQDPVRTPFNIGRRVDLKDWTFEEAFPLASGLGPDANRNKEVLRWVLEWTSGHPYLTQKLCATIAEQRRTDWTKAAVAEVVSRTLFGSDRDFDTNLQFVRDMLTWRATNQEAVLRIYKDIRKGNSVRDESRHKDALDPDASVQDEDKSLHKAHLKLAGLVRSEDGKLQVRNRVYYEVFDDKWIKQVMPVNWQRRLYYAAATFVILLLCVTAPLSVYALRKGREAERQRVLALNQASELAKANDRYAEINKQLNQTNGELAIANQRYADTNGKLTEANARYAHTNQELETSNALLEKAKQEALRNAQQAEGAAQRATESEQRAIKEQTTAQAERAHAEAEAQRAAASEAKTRVFLSSLYLKEAKDPDNEKDPERATAYLMAGYEQAKDLPGSKEKEILNLLTDTSQFVNPLIDFDQSGFAEISPNGKYVISIDTAGKARLWNSQTGKLITELAGQGYSSPVGYFPVPITNTRQLTSWSKDSERFVLERSCPPSRIDQSCTSSVAIFDGETGNRINEAETIWGPKEVATSTTFVWPDAKDHNERFLSVDGKGIQLWNSRTGKPIALISNAPSAPLWAATGQRFITFGTEGQVQFWNAEKGSEVITLPVKLEVIPSVYHVSLFAARSRVLTQNAQGVKLWDAMSGKLVNDLPITGTVDDFAVTIDDQVAYTHAGDKAQLWKVKDGVLIKEIPVNATQTYLFSYSILTVATTGQVQLWDAFTGTHIEDLNVGIPSLVSTGSGERVLISSGTELSLWSARTGKLIKKLPTFTYVAADWFDNDAWFLILNQEGKGELRDGNTGDLVRFVPLKYPFNVLMAPSVTGKQILTRNNTTGWLQLWDLKFEPITLDEVLAKAKCSRFTVKDEVLVELNPPPCRQ